MLYFKSEVCTLIDYLVDREMILSSYVCSMYILQMAARGSRAGQADPGVGGGGGGGGGEGGREGD